MAKVIRPATIELDVDLEEVRKQAMEEQLPPQILLFGEKYMIKMFDAGPNVGCPDIRSVTIELVRFEE